LYLGGYDATYVLRWNVKRHVLTVNVINGPIIFGQQLRIFHLLSRRITPLKLPPVRVDVLKFVSATPQNPLSEGACHNANGTLPDLLH
jgi:hypothetical protein